MQCNKNKLLLKYKEHPVLYSFFALATWLFKDFVIEVYHKGIAIQAAKSLTSIQGYLSTIQTWLKSSHSFSGYLLTLYLVSTVCAVGVLYLLFWRTRQQLITLQNERKNNEKEQARTQTPYDSDTIQGIRWRWENGWGAHDIYNLSPYCPDTTCDGELKPTPFTRQYPAKVVHICAHCGKVAHTLKYNLNLHHHTKAAESFYEDIKTEIRRRKRHKESEEH